MVVHFNDSSVKAQKYISQVESEIRPSAVQVYATGQVPINLAFNNTLEQDLQRAEYVALPITLILLVLIFASVVAAVLPISVGVLAIVGGVGGTLFLARFTDVSQYAINVVTLIGLGRRDRLLAVHRQPVPRRAGGRRVARGCDREVDVHSGARDHLLRRHGGDRPVGDALLPGHVPGLDGRRGRDRRRDRGRLRPDLPAGAAVGARAEGGSPATTVPRQPQAGRHGRLAFDGRLGDAPAVVRARAGARDPSGGGHAVPAAAPGQRRRRSAAAQQPGAPGLRHPGQRFSRPGPDHHRCGRLLPRRQSADRGPHRGDLRPDPAPRGAAVRASRRQHRERRPEPDARAIPEPLFRARPLSCPARCSRR